MEEKILKTKKNGMPILILSLLLYAAAIAGAVIGGFLIKDGKNPALLIVSVIILCTAWLLWPGLRVIGPQEALVLTLFGRYIGTLKEPGFYFVNPFCTALNPASKTILSQSGDVKSKKGAPGTDLESYTKKISLKILTLCNNRQKINDCLGNPIEDRKSVV